MGGAAFCWAVPLDEGGGEKKKSEALFTDDSSQSGVSNHVYMQPGVSLRSCVLEDE